MGRMVKRVADPAVACLLLVALAPIFLAIAAAILVCDGWPIVFIQDRSGLNGHPFKMIKFRTMVPNAIRIGQQQGIAGDDPFGIVKGDPRITRLGRLLRRTSMDELPQLINVVRGEMSLVGPRPDLIEQVANYSKSDRRRLAVLPGITGYSQIHGRDEISWPERINQDCWYIEHWSLLLDAKILLGTVSQFFRGEPDPLVDTLNIERARALNTRSNARDRAHGTLRDEGG